MNFMMFAFVMHETRRRLFARAYSKAKRMIRSEPLGADRLDRDARVGCDLLRLASRSASRSRRGVVGACLELDPGVEILGVLADDDEVDALVAGADARGRTCTGRTHAYRPSS